MNRRLAVALSLVAVMPLATAADLVGRVVHVADGDTLTVLVDRAKVTVRLTEIDAPERGQDFGDQSRQSLAEICDGKAARIDSPGMDRYQRTLGRVYCDGLDANAEQVRRGMAWVFDRYVTDPSLYSLQEEARARRDGFGTDPNPVPP